MRLEPFVIAALLAASLATPTHVRAQSDAETEDQMATPDDEAAEPSPALFPELHGNTGLVFDPATKLDPAARDSVQAVLAEHQGAAGDTLKIAVLESPPKAPSLEQAAAQLYNDWSPDADLVKEHEAVLVCALSTGECALHYSLDLESTLAPLQAKITGNTARALSKNPSLGAATGALLLLRAISSPLAESEAPRRLAPWLAPSSAGPSTAMTWTLVILGLLVALGFWLLLSQQEIHISSEGAHRIRPHERLRALIESARGRNESLGDPAAAAEGGWSK